MPVADKYRLHRQIDWSDEAEVHAGPLDPTWKVPVAVKIRHGMGGPIRPDGKRDRFLRAAGEQAAAVLAGCKGIAPVFETGQEENAAFYVTKHYPRSLAKLVEGKVRLNPAALGRLTDGVLHTLEELRDKGGRSHGNLKLTNVFLDGKDVQSAPILVTDLGLKDEASQAADCQQLGAILYQLIREQFVGDFDWPIEDGPAWEKLGSQANAWRRFCNVLRSPDLGQQDAPLAGVRQAFKKMKARANDAPSLSGAGAQRSRPEAQAAPASGGEGGGKGWLAGLAAGLAALVGAGALYVSQTSKKVSERLGGTANKVNKVANLLPALGGGLPGGRALTPNGSSLDASLSLNVDGTAKVLQKDTFFKAPGFPRTQIEIPVFPGASPTVPPMVVDVPPTPTPRDDSQSLEWTKYLALLDQFKGSLNTPGVVEDAGQLGGALDQFKERVQYLPINGSDQGVGDFLRNLPPKLEPSGDFPALPANLWTKVSAAKVDGMQTVTYRWGQSDINVQFNRVPLPGSNGPAAFYLSAAAVPVRFGLLLAQATEARARLRATAPGYTGPMSWEYRNGQYAYHAAWITADPGINRPFYGNAGGPTPDSPMNGLTGPEAFGLAQAAGCSLPTLRQWAATLNSPAGRTWTSQWRTLAKVRSPEWAQFAKGIVDRRVTGVLLPNQQCFGNVGARNLDPVTTTPDANLFFEPVNKREAGGFYHLIGNVGQYVTDEGTPPAKYYFAGGSAVSAPDTFADLANPPAMPAPYPAADAGFRLAARAQGNGQEGNKPLENLKKSLDVEISRAEALEKASR